MMSQRAACFHPPGMDGAARAAPYRNGAGAPTLAAMNQRRDLFPPIEPVADDALLQYARATRMAAE